MVKSEKDLCCLKLIGGHLALNFSNSVWRRSSSGPCEILETYARLVEWARVAGGLSAEQASVLRKEAIQRESEAAIVLERALTLREAIYDTFSPIAGSDSPDPRALATLNCELSTALCRRRIEGSPPDFAWTWGGSAVALDQMLWPIVHSAAELLTSEDLRWVRECQAADCDRLFLDTSRNRRRRWCNMEWCGNREKARRALSRETPGRRLRGEG
jgi:predicted RNA-binding Zn ribbon-like protein